MTIINLNSYLNPIPNCNTGYWIIELMRYFPDSNTTISDVFFEYSNSLINNNLNNPIPSVYSGAMINLPVGTQYIQLDSSYNTKEYVEIEASYVDNCTSACVIKKKIKIREQNNLITQSISTISSEARLGLDSKSLASNRNCVTNGNFGVGLIVTEDNKYALDFFKTVKGTGIYYSTIDNENTLERIDISNEVAPVWSYYVCQNYTRNNLLETIVHSSLIQCNTFDILGTGTGYLDLSDTPANIEEAIKLGFRAHLLSSNNGFSVNEINNFINGMSVDIQIGLGHLITIKILHKPHYCGPNNSWGIQVYDSITSNFNISGSFTSTVNVNINEATTSSKIIESNKLYCGVKLKTQIPPLNFIFNNNPSIFSSTGKVALIQSVNPFTPYFSISNVTPRWSIYYVQDSILITGKDYGNPKVTSCNLAAQVQFCHNRNPIDVNDMIIYKNNLVLTGVYTYPGICTNWINYNSGDVFKVEVITKAIPSCIITKIFTMT